MLRPVRTMIAGVLPWHWTCAGCAAGPISRCGCIIDEYSVRDQYIGDGVRQYTGHDGGDRVGVCVRWERITANAHLLCVRGLITKQAVSYAGIFQDCNHRASSGGHKQNANPAGKKKPVKISESKNKKNSRKFDSGGTYPSPLCGDT